jgi:hypothetical protein
VNLTWIKRSSFLRRMLRREVPLDVKQQNAAARSAVETIKPFIAGGPRRQLLYQGIAPAI